MKRAIERASGIAQHLERDLGAAERIARFEHGAGCAAAEPPQQLEAAEHDRVRRRAEQLCLDARLDQVRVELRRVACVCAAPVGRHRDGSSARPRVAPLAVR